MTAELEVTLTGAVLAPLTWTATSEEVLTVFWAAIPVALLAPELAVVTPSGAVVPVVWVGASATLRPVLALAALASAIELECWLVTVSEPLPPPTEPAFNCALSVVVCAWPAAPVAAPLEASTADCGLTVTGVLRGAVRDVVLGEVSDAAGALVVDVAEALGDGLGEGLGEAPGAAAAAFNVVAADGLADGLAEGTGVTGVADVDAALEVMAAEAAGATLGAVLELGALVLDCDAVLLVGAVVRGTVVLAVETCGAALLLF